jgi:thioredoxin-related protein
MKYIYLFIFSCLFFLIWGLLCLELEHSSSLSICVALVYTYIATGLVAEKYEDKNVYFYAAIFFGPTFYFITTFIFRPFNIIGYLIDPIIWCFVFFLAGLWKMRLNFSTLFLLLFVSYFYSFHLHPMGKAISEEGLLFEQVLDEKKLNDYNVNLDSFTFLNHELDTIKIKPNNKLIVLETWSGNCPPCLSAIADLQDYFDANKNIEHYYVYESNTISKYKKNKCYDGIKNKNKIIIDMNQALFKKMGMQSYPYFIVFDTEGNVVDYLSAYSSKYKAMFLEKLEKILSASKI